jgi:hypothetical protein
MKTKLLVQAITVAAAVLAVSTQHAVANVVGYYNVALAPGWNLLANQFIQNNYNANFVLPSGTPVDGSLLYRFNPLAQDYYDAGTYLTGVGWYPLSGNTNDPVLNLPLGEGFFIWTPQSWIATFVGQVAQGSLTNPLPANYSLKASMVPQAGALQTLLGFPPYHGDLVWRWVSPAFSGSVYRDSSNTWSPAEPSLNVGEGFFLYRSPDQATTDHWWVRNFTVQFAPTSPGGSKAGPLGTGNSPPAEISGLSFGNGNAVLAIKNPGGAPYAVQFSVDGVLWKTIATGQTATFWQEPARLGVQGYYQLVNQ